MAEPLTMYVCPVHGDCVTCPWSCRKTRTPIAVYRAGDVGCLISFVRDEVGTTCKVRRSGRPQWSCREERDSAALALATGEQPHRGPRWGVEAGTDTRAWTERAAAGGNLCLHCKAADLLARVLDESNPLDRP